MPVESPRLARLREVEIWIARVRLGAVLFGVLEVGILSERYPPETVVYPGHGPATTLGRELATNPFLSELRAELQS